MPSKGEIAIGEILKREKVEYREQFTFHDCKDRNCLPFDFVIFINGRYAIIEFDGRQHFEVTPCFHGHDPAKAQRGLEVQQYHDLVKNIYTRDNNISLLRISYREESQLETYLIQFINALKTSSKRITIFSNSRHESYLHPYGKSGFCVIV
jgi:hypothetical protein